MTTEVGRVTIGLEIDPSKIAAGMSAAKSTALAGAADIEKSINSKFSGGLSGISAGLTKSMSGDFGSVGKNIGQDIVSGIAAPFGTLGNVAASVASALGPTGIIAGAAIAGTALIGASAISAAESWEAGMARISKTTGIDAGTAAYATLNNELKNLLTTTPTTVTEIQSVATAAGSLGIAKGDIAEFTKISLEMGSAFDVPAEEAASSISKIRSQMKVLPAEAQTASSFAVHMGSAIDVMGNNYNATEAQILEFSTRVGGSLSTLGAGAYDVAGWGGMLTSVFPSAERAAGSFDSLLTNLTTNTDAQAKASEMLGISTSDFMAEMQTDPSETILKLSDAMSESNNQLADAKTLGGSYGMDTLVKMTGHTDEYRKALTEANEAGKAGTSIQGSYERSVQNMQAQMGMLTNSLTAVAIDIGTPIVSAITPAISGITSGINTLRGTGEAVFGAITSSSAFQQLTNLGTTISSGFSGIAGSLSGTFGQIGTSLNNIFGGDALGNITNALLMPLSMSLQAVNMLASAWFTVQGAVVSVGGSIATGVLSNIEKVLAALKTAKAYLQAFGEVTGLSKAFDAAQDKVTGIIDAVSDIGSKISSGLTSAIPTAISGLQGALGSLASQFSNMITNALAGGLSQVAGALGLGDVASKLSEISTRANEILKTDAQAGVSSGVAEGIKNGVEAAGPSAAKSLAEDFAKANEDYAKAHPGGYSVVGGKIIGGSDSRSSLTDTSTEKIYSLLDTYILQNSYERGGETGLLSILSSSGDVLSSKSYLQGGSKVNPYGDFDAVKADLEDAVKPVILDLPKYMKTASTDMSSTLADALSDGVISWEEKEPLKELANQLDELRKLDPIEFELAGLDEKRLELQEALDGISVKVNLDKEDFAISAAEYMQNNMDLYKTMYSKGVVATDTTETSYYELIAALRETGNPEDTKTADRLQKIDDIIASGDKEQLGQLKPLVEYTMKVHPELARQTAFQQRIAIADAEIATNYKLIDGKVTPIVTATDATEKNTKGTEKNTADSLVYLGEIYQTLAAGGLGNVVNNIYGQSWQSTPITSDLSGASNWASTYGMGASWGTAKTGAALPSMHAARDILAAAGASYQQGGVTSREGIAYLHANELIASKDQFATGSSGVFSSLDEFNSAVRACVPGLWDYNDAQTAAVGSMQWLTNDQYFNDYPAPTITAPTSYRWSQYPAAPQVQEYNTDAIAVAWLSDAQTSMKDLYNNAIRQAQIDSIGNSLVQPWFAGGEIAQPSWWVEAATAASPDYASTWAASKGGTGEAIPNWISNPSIKSNQKLATSNAWDAIYDNSGTCIAFVEPDPSLKFTPGKQTTNTLDRDAWNAVYDNNGTCIAYVEPDSSLKFTPASQSTGVSNEFSALTKTTGKITDSFSVLLGAVDVLGEGIYQTANVLDNIPTATSWSSIDADIKSGISGTSVSGGNALVTGLSKEGYVLQYDPRTDTCEGLSFNPPSPSLKTTDPFYLGLTANSPAYKDYDTEYGWGGSVAQTDNPQLVALQQYAVQAAQASKTTNSVLSGIEKYAQKTDASIVSVKNQGTTSIATLKSQDGTLTKINANTGAVISTSKGTDQNTSDLVAISQTQLGLQRRDITSTKKGRWSTVDRQVLVAVQRVVVMDHIMGIPGTLVEHPG